MRGFILGALGVGWFVTLISLVLALLVVRSPFADLVEGEPELVVGLHTDVGG